MPYKMLRQLAVWMFVAACATEPVEPVDDDGEDPATDVDADESPDGDTSSLPAVTCTFTEATLASPTAINNVASCMAAKFDPLAVQMGSFTHDEKTGAYIWRVNWSAAYQLHAYLDFYETTGDVQWLQRFARQAHVMLDQRDSVLGLVDYKGNSVPGWQQRARTSLGTPYTYNWLGYNAHVYYPMMRFAALVQATPALQTLAADNVTLETWSSVYVSGFLNMVKFSATELRDNGTSAYYAFESNVPDDPADSSNTASLRSKPLPVNMASAVFGAYLALGKYYAAKNDSLHATKFTGLSARYLTWLRTGSASVTTTQKPLFETRVQSSGASYLVWRYAAYTSEMEDIGHSNLTFRYMMDARRAGQATLTEQVRLENTFLLVDSPIINGLKGSTARVYLDASPANGESHTSFYLPLAVRAKATLRISAIWIAQRFDAASGLAYLGALAVAYKRAE
jgi:hypothetical protein